MITNAGEDLIMRYLAGYVGQIGDSISVGIGSAVEADTDTNLQFELNSQRIQQIGIDLAGRRLIFKATIPQEVGGTIQEVSLWSKQSANGIMPDAFVTPVDSSSEIWTGGTWDTGSRINGSTVRITAVASGSAGASPEAFAKDLSVFNSQDKIVVAYEVVQNVSSLRIDIGTDAANRYSATIAAPPVGYNITSISLGNFAKTGSPNWATSIYLAAVVTATSAGTGIVKLDGIRVNEASPVGIMVSRKVLEQQIVKEINAPLDIEYALPVTIS